MSRSRSIRRAIGGVLDQAVGPGLRRVEEGDPAAMLLFLTQNLLETLKPRRMQG